MDVLKLALLVFSLVFLSDLCVSDDDVSIRRLDGSLSSESGRRGKPSSAFVNFVAVMSGLFENSQEVVSGAAHATNYAKKIVPTQVDSDDGDVVLLGEQYLDNQLINRILYILEEKVRGEKFLIHPVQLTQAHSGLFAVRNGEFKLNKPKLFLRDLGYNNSCTREVKPIKGSASVFEITRWPFCTDDQKNPPIYTGTVNCTHLVVVKEDARYMMKTSTAGRRVILQKNRSFNVPSVITGDGSCFKNPCL